MATRGVSLSTLPTRGPALRAGRPRLRSRAPRSGDHRPVHQRIGVRKAHLDGVGVCARQRPEPGETRAVGDPAHDVGNEQLAARRRASLETSLQTRSSVSEPRRASRRPCRPARRPTRTTSSPCHRCAVRKRARAPARAREDPLGRRQDLERGEASSSVTAIVSGAARSRRARHVRARLPG